MELRAGHVRGPRHLPKGIRGIIDAHGLQGQSVDDIPIKRYITNFVEFRVESEMLSEDQGLLTKCSTEAQINRTQAIHVFWIDLIKRFPMMNLSLEDLTKKTLTKNISTRKSNRKALPKSNAQKALTVLIHSDTSHQAEITGSNGHSPEPQNALVLASLDNLSTDLSLDSNNDELETSSSVSELQISNDWNTY